MDMKTLDYFIQAAKTQSFSQAAKDCRISQTAMSLAISKLENEIGAMLFDRDKRPMVLTTEGREFYDWALETTDGFAKITGVKPDAEKKPLFAVGVANSYDALALNYYMRAFKKENVSITVITRIFPPSAICEGLANDEADGFFVPPYLFESDPDVQSITVDTFPMVIAISCDHELAALSRISSATLRGYTCAAITYSGLGLTESTLSRQMHAENIKFKRVLQMEFAEEALLYAANNGALAFLPGIVSKFLPEGFTAIPIEGCNITVPFAFCTRKDNERLETAAFKKFLERGEV